MKKQRILFAAAEITPLAKTGGLGDVIGALPKSLQPYTKQVMIALPFYSVIQKQELKHLRKIDTVAVTVQHKSVVVSVWKTFYPPADTWLLLFKQVDFLSRGGIYDGLAVLNPLTGKIFTKDGMGQNIRYLFFSYAITAYLQRHPKQFDIVQAHDFHLAPLLALLKQDAKLSTIKTIQTIHNLFYTGSLQAPHWEMFQPSLYHHFEISEKRRQLGPRMLWLGIHSADAVTTVSPQYAKEILTPEYGNDLELLLQKRQRQLFSVINGIDTERFNPATDSAVHRTFSDRTIKRRVQNKIFLQRLCGLPIDPTIPVIGLVARLTTQKGINLIIANLPQLTALRAQFVVCGTGPKNYMRAFQEIAAHYPLQWHFHNTFDTIFSQYVYSGSDIFLMPSRHEPCGLAQMIAMRYGAVPVVRATGGLKDTVRDNYNGFVFTEYSSKAMLVSIKRAITLFINQPDQWHKLMHHGMIGDYGWDVSAQAYGRLYTKLAQHQHTT